MKKLILLALSAFLGFTQIQASTPQTVDLLIVGGGASGVAAGIQASRMGTQALIIEEQPWIGGMITSAGVSCTDGNYDMRGGIWGEFLANVAEYYGGYDALKTSWVSNAALEPSVGERILRQMVAAEPNLQVKNGVTLISLGRDNGKWLATVRDNDGNISIIESRLVIDGTELGDVAKMAGVKYDIGMESRLLTGEDIAPMHANNIIQDLTWVAVLKDYGKDSSIERPASYDRMNYACCSINPLCTDPAEPDRMHLPDTMITYGKMPNDKYMINWPISGNDYYTNVIELDREQREVEYAKAREFTLGFIYFLQQELGFKNLGLADDEFPSADRLALIPYHRESRRIHGLVRFDLNDMVDLYNRPTALYRTTVAVGDYPVDHHHARYTGADSLPNLYFHPVPSYGLPMGTLIPKDVKGLLVTEKSISVSNIVNGATREQPVVLQIGQAAGVIAALALSQDIDVKDVSVRDVQRVLLDAGGYLLPYLDVEPSDPMFKTLQHIGSCGLLHSTSKRAGWANQTWIYPERPLLGADIKVLGQFFDTELPDFDDDSQITVGQAISALKMLAQHYAISLKNANIEKLAKQLWKKYNLGKYNSKAAITRGQYAVLVDEIFKPFDAREVDINGMLLDFENQASL